ncbi:hypothetical protein ATCVMO0605SPH_584L [Acanthocystis turfacea Chlorella virus MO0605SPH]|nr:hypothetical protein ATCVMO0605SPH_584L [Acanthocystis turfacea Chlorella virus MO0605SPH]
MKKRYIFGIVITALLAVAVIAFFVYKNLDDIKDAFSGTKKTPNAQAGVVKAVLTTSKVAPTSPDAIVNATKSNSRLSAELNALKRKTQELANTANKTFDKVLYTFKAEAKTKASQSTPVSDIVVENTKQRKAKDEDAAADKYMEILKQIEIEKAKAAISLTGARTESQKTATLNTLNIDALDAEMELYSENRIRTQASRKPFSKGEAEAYVKYFT